MDNTQIVKTGLLDLRHTALEKEADLKRALWTNAFQYRVISVSPVGLQDVYDAYEEQESLSFTTDRRDPTHSTDREREREMIYQIKLVILI